MILSVQCNSVLLLCSLLLVTAINAAKIPEAPEVTPCCVPNTMTLEEHLFEVANGQASTKHITHYVDLGPNARYAQRINTPGAASYEYVYFNKNNTRYYNSPSAKICIETKFEPSVTNCVLSDTTFTNTAWVGELALVVVNNFTYLHDNVMDSVQVTKLNCIPIGSMVYKTNTISKSSYFNSTRTSPDPSIFYLPPYCFVKPRPAFENVKHLLPADAGNVHFIL